MALGRVMAIGGGLGLLLALVMPWYGERGDLDPSGSDVETYTAFQEFRATDIALLVLALVVIAAVALGPLVARRAGYLRSAERPQGELSAALLALVAALVGLALVLVKLAGPLPEDAFVLRYGARF